MLTVPEEPWCRGASEELQRLNRTGGKVSIPDKPLWVGLSLVPFPCLFPQLPKEHSSSELPASLGDLRELSGQNA